MLKLKILPLLIAIAWLSTISNVYSQQNDGDFQRCGSMEVLERQLEENPKFRQIRKDIERQTQEYINNKNRDQDGDVIIIPTVFHIIHDGDPIGTNENIDDVYILAQFDQMNDDFRRTNSDADGTWSQAADTNIEFCLAVLDPNGDPTTGIVRHNISGGPWTDTSFDATVKPATIWDRDLYLNVWVADLSGGLLGYAQFPGGPANTDGVVNVYTSIGSIDTPNPNGGAFDLGRTVTHEVGHWLNCFHIWGDDGSSCNGSDSCADTPNQAGSTSGCPSGVQTDACATTSPGYMYQNYMDYSDDVCMNLFTEGQRDRMQALFDTGGARESLVAAPCGSLDPEAPVSSFTPDTGPLDYCLPSGAIPFSNTTTGFPTPTWSWTFSGAGVSPTSSTDMDPSVTVTSSGTLVATLVSSNSEGSDTQTSNIVINMLPSSDPACNVPICDTAGTDIPDDDTNGLSRTINIPSGGTVSDVIVELDISHTYIGDLKAELEHLGTTVVLFDRPGVPDSNFGCSGNDITDCFFDDASTNGTVEDVCGNNPAITGDYNPEDALSAFDGMDEAGDWTLTVFDFEGGDDGTLDEWCLDITATVDPGPDCLTMAQLIGTVTGVEDYESMDFIETTQTLVSGSQVDFDAVQSILLDSGFEVEAGAIMEAFIDGCNNGGGGVNLKGDLNIEEK